MPKSQCQFVNFSRTGIALFKKLNNIY